MKVKKIKIGIKDMKGILDDVVKSGEAIERGERLKPVKEPEIYFTSFEVFRKAFTPKRLELLHIIKTWINYIKPLLIVYVSCNLLQ